MAETDALDRLLAVAEAEGALGPEGTAAFAQGLRERARLVLEDRVLPLERRVRDLESAVAALEKENAWRRETTSSLEAQVAWLKEQEQGLRASLDESRREGEALRVALDGTRNEAEKLRVARDQGATLLVESQAVHDRLLAHHRHVVEGAVRQFATAASLPLWKFRACRAQLRDAAAQFARELA